MCSGELLRDIDPLQLRHIIRGISVYYPEAAILEDRNTLASYAISIETCAYNSLHINHISSNLTHTRSIVGAWLCLPRLP